MRNLFSFDSGKRRKTKKMLRWKFRRLSVSASDYINWKNRTFFKKYQFSYKKTNFRQWLHNESFKSVPCSSNHPSVMNPFALPWMHKLVALVFSYLFLILCWYWEQQKDGTTCHSWMPNSRQYSGLTNIQKLLICYILRSISLIPVAARLTARNEAVIFFPPRTRRRSPNHLSSH